MNFEEWYKSWRGEDYNNGQPKSGELQIGWDACKEEVLKILNTTTHTSNGIEIYFGNNQDLIDKLKQEIEKL